MKKIALSFLALMVAFISFSQTTTSWKKKPSLTVSMFWKDFKNPALLKQYSLSKVLTDRKWVNGDDMNKGASISYLEGLTEYIDIAGSLYGSSVDYPFYLKPTGPSHKDGFLLEGDVQLHFKLVTDAYLFVPFLTLGLGASLHDWNYFGTYIPYGAGVQLKLAPKAFLISTVTYNARVSDLTNNNINYAVGLNYAIFKQKAAPVVVTPPPPPPAPVVVEKDTDGDGIVDSKDKCPTVAGLTKYEGCPIPDTDGDGINDEEDKCVTVKGIAKYQGCPIPDTDGDGINDEEDKCPNEKGLARYQGCPIPDTDGDGINDEEDKCPTEKGTAANQGCPELKDFNFEAKNIQFLSGSAILTKDAKAELDKLAKILGEHPTLNVLIEGYTDNTGKPETNLKLSQKRAESVRDYLVGKSVNVSRLTPTGYGIIKPIADNKTPKGRLENRRVEFKIKK